MFTRNHTKLIEDLRSYAYKSPRLCNLVLRRGPPSRMKFTLLTTARSAFLFLTALLTAWPLSDICLHVYLLFTPTEREPHGNTDLLCPTGAVFSAARRIPNAEGTRCAFAGYVFHLSFISKLWSLKEGRKRYFKVIQNHTLHSGITNNRKTPTLTKGTKSIGGVLVQDPGRHKTVAACRRWIANQLEAETDLIRYPTSRNWFEWTARWQCSLNSESPNKTLLSLKRNTILAQKWSHPILYMWPCFYHETNNALSRYS